jgi:hypothetical protein
MSARPRPALPRSPGIRILLVAAVAASVIGGFVFVTTAMGLGHADVRGLRLQGTLEALFLAGVGISAAGAAAAAAGLRRGRRWAVVLFAAVWPFFAIVCLALDRMAPVAGPGRPLAFYLLWIGLLPAGLVLLLGRPWLRGGVTAPRASG